MQNLIEDNFNVHIAKEQILLLLVLFMSLIIFILVMIFAPSKNNKYKPNPNSYVPAEESVKDFN